MGLLDGFEKIVNTVSRSANVVNKGVGSAESLKRNADKVGKVIAPKCKFCKAELKNDIEKKKGMCANCALQRA
ncbi:MAG: hypothetical protein ABID38_00080 [Candidatus Diapherotrites archaeon]